MYTDELTSEMQASGDYVALWEVIPVVAEILTS